MYRMSILTLLCPPSLSKRINTSRATLLALVHDMSESLVGDITPLDKVPKEEKHRREALTIEYLTSSKLLPASLASSAGTTIRDAWHEYEENQTLEATYVHDIDKLELLLQMVEYERRENGTVDLGEFVRVSQHVRLDEMKAWCEDVLKEREKFWREVAREIGANENPDPGPETTQPVTKTPTTSTSNPEMKRKPQTIEEKRALVEDVLRTIAAQKSESEKKHNNPAIPDGVSTDTNTKTNNNQGVANGVSNNEAEKQNNPPDFPRPKTPLTPSKKGTPAMEFSKYGSPDKPRRSKEHR
ncbi:MAG: hypothetical protein Q9174_007037 [Haloplaca sp. 1 TL-2023]